MDTSRNTDKPNALSNAPGDKVGPQSSPDADGDYNDYSEPDVDTVGGRDGASHNSSGMLGNC